MKDFAFFRIWHFTSSHLLFQGKAKYKNKDKLKNKNDLEGLISFKVYFFPEIKYLCGFKANKTSILLCLSILKIIINLTPKVIITFALEHIVFWELRFWEFFHFLGNEKNPLFMRSWDVFLKLTGEIFPFLGRFFRFWGIFPKFGNIFGKTKNIKRMVL